jgi:hypothetical protein
MAMTQQMNERGSALSASVRMKLLRFADELTDEDAAQLALLRPSLRSEALTPSLRAKVERAAGDFTADEAAELRRLSGANRADAAGYMKPLYEDGEGNKGRPRPTEGTGGGGGAVEALGDLLGEKYRQHRDGITMLINALPTFVRW